MAEYLDWVFDAEGPLKQLFPNYTPRPGQIIMANAVEVALQNRRHVIAEAPTGTGKTFAYGTPLCCRSANGGGVGIIVTGNITLQEQLLKKDLPLLEKALPWPFTYCLLKGKNNYLCLDLYDKILSKHQKPVLPPDQEQQFMAVMKWAATTTDGDSSGLDFMPDPVVWNEFSVTADGCKGSECRFAKTCHANRAKSAAMAKNIIITNYHYYFGHILVREETGEDIVLPAHNAVVFDEAHKMVDMARDFFGTRVTYGAVRRAAGKIDKGSQLYDTITGYARQLFLSLGTFCQSRDYNVRLRQPPPYEQLYLDLYKELLLLASKYSVMAQVRRDPDEKAELYVYERRARRLADNLEDSMTLSNPENIYYLEPDGHGFAALCSRQVDVSDRLRQGIFTAIPSAILTSATLSTNEDFSYLRHEIGLDQADEVIVESPFDWNRQALIIVPEDSPNPSDIRGPAFEQFVAQQLAKTIELASGRTLALFTSWGCLNAAHAALLKGSKYRILKQGDMPRQKLIAEFSKDTNSVLLGTASLWEGIDIPGESLSCVFIDKLPFQQMTDPVLDAIKERDPKGWFGTFYLPRSIIALKQGFGRLIRTSTDHGVVVILDGRLLDRFKKGYRHEFWHSLPPAMLSHNLEDLGRFLSDQPGLAT